MNKVKMVILMPGRIGVEQFACKGWEIADLGQRAFIFNIHQSLRGRGNVSGENLVKQPPDQRGI